MTMTGKKIYNSDGRSSEDKALDKFAEMMIEKIKTYRAEIAKGFHSERRKEFPGVHHDIHCCR